MSATDDARLLELVGEVGGLHEMDEFRVGLVRALRRLIPSDWVSVNGVGSATGEAWGVVDPTMSARDHATWTRLGHENPLAQHFLSSADGSARRFSDVTTTEELESTALHRELYARIGLQHQLAFTLPAEPARIIGVALSRRTLAYSDSERELANRARPFLVQGYRTALAFEVARAGTRPDFGRPPAERLVATGLTAREAEVIALIARGRANADVASELELSTRTVDKHVERAFRKLGVTSRSQAAARVWEIVDVRR